MSNETSTAERSYSTNRGAIDVKARKRIEELYMLTNEIIDEQRHAQQKYDHRLYQKYKRLKKINRKLQEKLLNQHCSGCHCHFASDEDVMPAQNHSNDVTPMNYEDLHHNQQGNPTVAFRIENYIENENRFEESLLSDNHEVMIMPNEFPSQMTKTTATNNYLNGSRTIDNHDTSRLPVNLRVLIKKEVEKDPKRLNYLLHINSYPIVRQYLLDQSPNSFDRFLDKTDLFPLVKEHFPNVGKNFIRIVLRIRRELQTLRQACLRQFMKIPDEQDTIGRRKRLYQRATAKNVRSG